MASAPILTLPLTTVRGFSTIEQSTVETRYRRTVKYLAEITGTDPKFSLARKFLRRVSTRTVGNYFSIAGIERGKIIEFGFDDKSKRYGIVNSLTSSTITLDEASSHDVMAIASTMDEPEFAEVRDGPGFSDTSDEETTPSTTEVVAGIFEGDEDEDEAEPSERLASAQDIESFRDRFKRRIS
jgi:hypothetical protein